MSIATLTKDPAAVLDYTINWALWLAPGDTIASSTWAVSPSGPTLGLAAFTDKTATQWLSGGTAGSSYTLSNTVVTSQGRTDKRSITITVEQK